MSKGYLSLKNEAKRRAAQLGADEKATITQFLYPHFLSGKTQFKQITITPLVCAIDIVQDGKEQNHCVGGYTDDAAKGDSMLVSIVEGSERSTAEIKLQFDKTGEQPKRRLVVAQIHARSNDPASKRHLHALVTLLSGASQSDLAVLAFKLNKSREAFQELEQFDDMHISPEDRLAIADLVFSHVRRFLPKSWRRMERAALVDRLRVLYPIITDNQPA